MYGDKGIERIYLLQLVLVRGCVSRGQEQISTFEG